MEEKKKIISFNKTIDSLVLHYGSKEHKINADTFINSITGLNEILEASNDYLDPSYKFTITIITFSPGSFRAKISTKKKSKGSLFESAKKELGKNPIKTTAVAIALLLQCNGANQKVNHTTVYDNSIHIEGDNNMIYDIDSETYQVYSHLSQNNEKIRKGINKHFKALHKDKEITDFQILTQESEGDLLYRAEAREFSSLIISDKSDAKDLDENTTLMVYSPVLSDENKKWTFMWRGSHIKAYIKDEEFLSKMKARSIGFKQGDVIDVTLRRRQKFDETTQQYLDDTFEVVKVLSEPKASVDEQLNLEETKGLVSTSEDLVEEKDSELNYAYNIDEDDDDNRILVTN